MKGLDCILLFSSFLLKCNKYSIPSFEGQLGKILDFNQRLEIAIDIAHALTYLHLYAGKHITLSPFFLMHCQNFSPPKYFLLLCCQYL